MNAQKRVIRHGLVGGGFVTLLLAASFVVVLGVPTTPGTVGVVVWLALVGLAMFAAGRWERVLLGSTTLEWPRLAGIAIGLLAVGWGVVSAASLLTGDGITGLGPLEAVLTLGVVGYFAWFAKECWVGGDRIDSETFTVE
ncbi:hypothetical protein [Natronolimnohabitans innermongolicus]|uniref:Transmembrane protein n=1 Tax=Natronolimnohabitans innermongolicus JCM 12255 TaxID=1227499 RepID=L9WSS2_9EURY|nr:hypothetical protein [Natronolimnohabitans innermongolicus]ELY52509.1 hypothetical protein C493_15710 [Natronolimnohabitans innermongolicus JCM 12255]